MSVTVDFIFDFGSPNCYFAHRVLPDILARTGATANYIPCLLGGLFKETGNKPPLLAFGNIKNKLAYEQIEIVRFIEKHRLKAFQFNSNFPVNTLMLMRGAIVMEEEGRLDDYIEAGCQMMWEKGLKMDDADVFIEAMNAAGFDGATLLERTQDPAVKGKLAENTSAAVERGAFGMPTFFVGDDIYFGKDRLGQVEEAILAAG